MSGNARNLQRSPAPEHHLYRNEYRGSDNSICVESDRCFLASDLEQQLKLNESALVITSSQEIEGRIIDYHADLTGYDITIESKSASL
jgi:hypothetical protein